MILGVLGGAIALLGLATPAVAAPGWLAPVGLSAPGRDAHAVSVEMADAGDSVAVWNRGSTTGPGNVIQASTRAAGQSFSAPIEVSPSGSDPVLAMSPGGMAIVAWRELEGEVEETGGEKFINTARQVIKVSVMAPGGGFSTPVDAYAAPPTIIEVVDSIPKTIQQGGIPQTLRIAINAGGDAVLAWAENDPEAPDTTVMAMTRSAAGAYSSATRVSPAPSADQPAQQPEVAIDDGGNATVTWQHGEADALAVEAATKPAGSSFAPPETLSGALDAGEQAINPEVGSSASGETTVAWRRFSADESVVEAATRPAGGAFGAPEPVSAAGVQAFSPELDVAPSGALLAAWLTGPEPNGVQASLRAPGGTFSPPQGISAPDTDSDALSAAINSNGAAAVSWSTLADGRYTLQASVRPPAGAFPGPVPISASSENFLRADLALDSFGDVTAGWNQTVGSDEIAQVAGYDAFVPEIRGLSIPAGAVVGETVTFSATPFDVWPIGAASFSFGDGATASGNSVQHAYSAPGTYVVEATATDPAGTSTSGQGRIVVRPRTGFSVGKLQLNKKKGIARIPISFEERGSITVKGRGIRTARANPSAPGRVKLTVRAVGRSLKKLKKKGKLKIKLTVTFAPTGGEPASKGTRGTLRKKRR